MSININAFREDDRNLYLQIASVSLSRHEKEKQAFNSKIRDFIAKIIDASNEILFIEDYRWVSETVTFWERFLESEYSEIACFEIPKPREPLVSKRASAKAENLQIDSIIHWLVEKIGSKLSIDGSRSILAVGFSQLNQEITSEFLNAQGHLGYQSIRVITGSWDGYETSFQALRKVKETLQEVISSSNVLMPIVFLYDYAFGRLLYSTERSLKRVDIGNFRHEIWRDISEFQKCKIPLVYFIEQADYEFFDNSAQHRCWDEINISEYFLANYATSFETKKPLFKNPPTGRLETYPNLPLREDLVTKHGHENTDRAINRFITV